MLAGLVNRWSAAGQLVSSPHSCCRLLMLLQLLVVMAMIFFFFPASKPVRDLKAMTIGQLHHQQQPAAAAGGGAYLYNIVLDAGSTGSRIHIFKFEQKGSSLNLISDGFHQLKPGLSAFPDEPQKAADSLKPLLEEAMKAVPAAQQVHWGWGAVSAAGAAHAAGAAAGGDHAAAQVLHVCGSTCASGTQHPCRC